MKQYSLLYSDSTLNMMELCAYNTVVWYPYNEVGLGFLLFSLWCSQRNSQDLVPLPHLVNFEQSLVHRSTEDICHNQPSVEKNNAGIK